VLLFRSTVKYKTRPGRAGTLIAQPAEELCRIGPSLPKVKGIDEFVVVEQFSCRAVQ
jgi:hypothetical protein